MNDDRFNDDLREHYESQTLDPELRKAMIDQARQRGGWSAERVLVIVAVAAVLLFALQAALVPSRFAAPEEPDIAAASGRLRAPPEPVQPPFPQTLILTQQGATISCGGDEMHVNPRFVLSVDPEKAPMTCLVTIDGQRGVFHTMGDSTMNCAVDGDRVTCTERISVTPDPTLADPDFQPPESEPVNAAFVPADSEGLDIKSVVEENSGQLKYCYEKRLQENKDLEGKIEVTWTLEGGVATATEVLSNSTADPKLADCIVEKIQSWDFPVDAEGQVTWPFVFRSQASATAIVEEEEEVDLPSGSIDGEGDKAALKATVRRYSGQLQYCYEAQLRANPNLAGRVEVSWYVSNGRASDVSITSNTATTELADCVESKIRRWQFSEGVSGDVTWPFVFQTKE